MHHSLCDKLAMASLKVVSHRSKEGDRAHERRSSNWLLGVFYRDVLEQRHP